MPYIGDVLRFPFDQDAVETLADAGNARRAAAGKRVDDKPSRRRNEAHEPPHERDGLDRGVLAVGPVVGVGLRAVKEAGGGAAIAKATCIFPERRVRIVAIDVTAKRRALGRLALPAAAGAGVGERRQYFLAAVVN